MPEARPYQRILAWIQFDARDAGIAEKAVFLARLSGAHLAFLHVVEPEGFLDGGYAASTPRAETRQLEAAAARRLKFLAAQVGAGEADCHVVSGSARQTLPDALTLQKPDLVIAGEPHDYLYGAHDVLIASPGPRRQRGGGVARVLNLFGSWIGARAIGLAVGQGCARDDRRVNGKTSASRAGRSRCASVCSAL